MKLSANGAADIRLHEGFSASYYLDPIKIPTIGVGFTMRSAAFKKWWAANRVGVPFEPGCTMTRAEADQALIYLADEEYGAAVNRFLGKTVPQNVFDSMLSMVFNCGPGSLDWIWAQLAKNGDYDAAAERLRTTAVTAKRKDGTRVQLAGLVSRRADEAKLLSMGIYASGATVTMPTDDAMSDGVLMRGERGEAVANMQRNLTRMGFQLKADGVFGFGTEAKLISFQKSQGLTADGIAGPKTLVRLAT